jgi:hypothetical protein
VATFPPLHNILTLNVAEIVRKNCPPNQPPHEIARIIKSYRVKAKNVHEQIPNQISIGLFVVSCQGLKKTIVNKYTEIAQATIGSLGERVIVQASTLIEKYEFCKTNQ